MNRCWLIRFQIKTLFICEMERFAITHESILKTEAKLTPKNSFTTLCAHILGNQLIHVILLLIVFFFFSRAWMKITLCNSGLPCLNNVLLLLAVNTTDIKYEFPSI